MPLTSVTVPIAARLLNVSERDVPAFMERHGVQPEQPGLYAVVGVAWRRYPIDAIGKVRSKPVSRTELDSIHKSLEPRRAEKQRRNERARNHGFTPA